MRRTERRALTCTKRFVYGRTRSVLRAACTRDARQARLKKSPGHRPGEINMKLSLAATVAVLSLVPLTSHANDDRGRHSRPRAAQLQDCCTPGDEDFPKVGGNLGNQNYTRLKQ